MWRFMGAGLLGHGVGDLSVRHVLDWRVSNPKP